MTTSTISATAIGGARKLDRSRRSEASNDPAFAFGARSAAMILGTISSRSAEKPRSAVGDNGGDPLAVDDDVEADRPAGSLAARHPPAAAMLVELLQRSFEGGAEGARTGRNDGARDAVAKLDLVLVAVEA